MDVDNAFQSIDLILPDSQIVNDIESLLRSSEFRFSEDGSVIIDGEKRFVPSDVKITVVGKIAYSWNFNATYGEKYFRVKIALGEMHDTNRGWVDAQFGFLVLMYDENAQFMKADWFEQFEFDD